jgi:small-conductance mechanosensitive channel
MNDNTILRIKVPAHLYESVKEQLTITEATKAKKQFGAEFTVVKEKKMSVPKDGMKKVEEAPKEEAKMEEAPAKKERTLDELKAAKAMLDKKIHEMESKMQDEAKVEEVKEKVEEKKEEEEGEE